MQEIETVQLFNSYICKQN